MDSFMTGLGHPVGGLDHVLAMGAVGAWSVIVGRRAVWIWPLAFVTTMTLGFAAGQIGLSLPWVSGVIYSSTLVLALMVALSVRASVWAGAVLVALFAFFHGHAHGTEVGAANPVAFATGFVLSTAGLHAAGMGLGLFAVRSREMAIAVRARGAISVFGKLARIGG